MTWTLPSNVRLVNLRVLAAAALGAAAAVVAIVLPATSSSTSVGGTAGSVGSSPPVARAAGGATTYFVSPAGNDANPGTSTTRPWRTVARVDRARLGRGDRVLFQGGAIFRDSTLMPGYGFAVSGTAGAPIVFSSYGAGTATLTRGIWLGHDSAHRSGPSHLTFRNLALGPVQGFQGTGSHITLQGLTISNLGRNSHPEVGIETQGSHWVITGNRVENTGDSGLLLGFNVNAAGAPEGGDHYVVTHNVIVNTGRDASIPYARHGIYLKVADALVAHNWIVNFSADGVSARFRNATITGNYISNGAIGVAWYQYDRRPGVVRLLGNAISNTTEAGIFVCGVREGCVPPIERFVVKDNTLNEMHGAQMNLQPTSGGYDVASNVASNLPSASNVASNPPSVP